MNTFSTKSLALDFFQLKKALEDLEQDFRTIPDDKKNFIELQDRLEALLKMTSSLSSQEREPLLPTLRNFQAFLKEHLEDIQKQASMLQIDLQERTTHKRATQAYGQFNTVKNR